MIWFKQYLKVLSSWKDALPDGYTVSDFITVIQEWYDDNYLDDDVWKRLRQCVSAEILQGLGNREPVMPSEDTQELELLSNMKAERKAESMKKM